MKFTPEQYHKKKGAFAPSCHLTLSVLECVRRDQLSRRIPSALHQIAVSAPAASQMCRLGSRRVVRCSDQLSQTVAHCVVGRHVVCCRGAYPSVLLEYSTLGQDC